MSTQGELLDSLINLAEQQARQVLLGLKRPSLLPTWVLVDRAGDFIIVATPWRDEPEKHLCAAKLRLEMRKRRVRAYSFVTEAWTRRLEAEEWDHESGQPSDGVQARNHPEREETVIACACGFGLEPRWKQWRIVREATTERIIDLKEQPFPESVVEPQGWISRMLE
jgi:hypothetical protein